MSFTLSSAPAEIFAREFELKLSTLYDRRVPWQVKTKVRFDPVAAEVTELSATDLPTKHIFAATFIGELVVVSAQPLHERLSRPVNAVPPLQRGIDRNAVALVSSIIAVEVELPGGPDDVEQSDVEAYLPIAAPMAFAFWRRCAIHNLTFAGMPGEALLPRDHKHFLDTAKTRRATIDVNDPADLEYWAREFDVGIDELRRVIDTAGTSVRAVREQLATA